MVEAAVGEERVDEHLLAGRRAAAEQGDEVAVLHLEQQAHLVEELPHPLPRLQRQLLHRDLLPAPQNTLNNEFDSANKLQAPLGSI